MKRIIIAMLLVLGFIISAQAVSVSRESDFKELFMSGENIELAASLTFNNNTLGTSGSNLNMTVDLGTYTLSFLNNYSEYSGGAISND